MRKSVSIQNKLTWIVMLTTGIALLLALIAIAAYDVNIFLREKEKDLSAQAELIRQNCTAALIFHDESSANEFLAELKAHSNITSAAIYTKEGRVFAKYLRHNIKEDFSFPEHLVDGTRFKDRHLVIFRGIVYDGKRLGTVYIQSDVEELIERMKAHLYVSVLVLIPVLLLALLLSTYLQRVITKPILNLAEKATQVSSGSDYSIRAVKRSADEIGTLVDRFNEMLTQIQERDEALREAHDKLDERVKERTQELEHEVAVRKRAQGSLRSEKELAQTYLDVAKVMFLVLKTNHEVTLINQKGCEILGYKEDEIIGVDWVGNFVPNDVQQHVKSGFDKLMAGEVEPAEYFESPVITKNGEQRIIAWHNNIIKDQNGEITAIVSSGEDITERKRAEEELQGLNEQLVASQQQLSASNQELMTSMAELKASEGTLREREEQIRWIIDTAHDAVITMDARGVIKSWNSQAEKMFGWTADDAIGRDLCTTIIPVEYREAHKRGLKHFVATGEGSLLNRPVEFKGLHRVGREFPVELSISPTQLGQSILFSAFVRDITQRKRAEGELTKAKEGAEAANRELLETNKDLEQANLLAKEMAMKAQLANVAKSEFLANMSHEIRTPLNAIIGMTELALETELSSEQRGYVDVVQSSSEGLLSLINDILDFSKIEARQMEIEEIDFNLREVVEGAVEMFTVRSEAKGLELLCYVDPEIPSWVLGDPTRLRQILANLVGNAIKFTEEGEVVIKVESPNLMQAMMNKEKNLDLHFMISDTGIGISKQNSMKIFEKFSQVDSSTSRKFGGTGLGLNISKSLIELMGGELSVESEEDKGSTFHFDLSFPIGEVKSQDEMDISYLNSKDFTILVADDNDTNRFILSKTLNTCGFQVKEAESGLQALSILKNDKEAIDLIILDYQMPEMDGVELARRLRKDPKFTDLKMIMLSSVGFLNKNLKKELDIAESIPKPVKQSKLFEITSRALWHEKTDDDTVQVVETEEVTIKRIPNRILLVEDNLDNQRLTKKILEKGGYLVEIAENGQLALEAVRKFRYDSILMDIYMPVMDGFEATKSIRSYERSQKQDRTPIIALTAHAVEGYRDKCLQHDMDDYITKPLKKKNLLETVEKWIDPRPTILVADDTVENRNLIKNYLKKEGKYKLAFAVNGLEAVDIFKKRTISLILMDMEMPVMDGYTAVKTIRDLETDFEVPILALSAHQGYSEIDRCLRAGCSEYIAKPIRKKTLFQHIYRYLAPHDTSSKAKVIKSDEGSQTINITQKVK